MKQFINKSIFGLAILGLTMACSTEEYTGDRENLRSSPSQKSVDQLAQEYLDLTNPNAAPKALSQAEKDYRQALKDLRDYLSSQVPVFKNTAAENFRAEIMLLRVQYEGDPAGFKTAADQARATYIAAVKQQESDRETAATDNAQVMSTYKQQKSLLVSSCRAKRPTSCNIQTQKFATVEDEKAAVAAGTNKIDWSTCKSDMKAAHKLAVESDGCQNAIDQVNVFLGK